MDASGWLIDDGFDLEKIGILSSSIDHEYENWVKLRANGWVKRRVGPLICHLKSYSYKYTVFDPLMLGVTYFCSMEQVNEYLRLKLSINNRSPPQTVTDTRSVEIGANKRKLVDQTIFPEDTRRGFNVNSFATVAAKSDIISTGCITPLVLINKNIISQPATVSPMSQPQQRSLSPVVAPQAKSVSPLAPEPVTVSKDLHALASLMFGSSTSNLPLMSKPVQVLDEVYKSYCRVSAESQSPDVALWVSESEQQEEEPVVPFWQQKNQQQYLQTQQLSYEYKYDYHDNSSIRIEYAPVRSRHTEQQQVTRIEIDTDFPAPVIQPVSALYRSQRC